MFNPLKLFKPGRRPILDARGEAFSGSIQIHNTYRLDHWRDGVLLATVDAKNLVTTEGLNDLLDQYLTGSTYTAAWYVGLIDNASFTEVAADDTAAKIIETVNHPTTNDWQEDTSYDEATREGLTLGTPADGERRACT